MTDWIKARADDIRRAEQEKKAERERQVVAANEVKAKTEPFWNDLVSVLGESVKAFNVEFPEAERRIDQFDRLATVVTIRRTTYPSSVVKVSLNTAGTSIHYSISTTPRKGANPVEKQANVGIGLIHGEARYTEGGVGTHEDVAKLFLESFFEF